MSYAEANSDALLEVDFRIGTIISKSLSIFIRNIVPFTFISGAVMLPGVALAIAMRYGAVAWNKWTYLAIALPLTLFLMSLTTAIILHAAFQHMRGRPVRLDEAISHGLSRFLPLLGVMLLSGIGAALGLLLLIAPGVILLVMWYVAVPVCVVENAGPDQSLRRSAALTKGLRWKIFALLLVSYVVHVGGGELLASAARTFDDDYWLQIATEVVWQGLSGGFSSVLVAVAYYYLRVGKEGVDVDQIAAVFD